MYPLLSSSEHLINDSIKFLLQLPSRDSKIKGIVSSNMKINNEYVTLILKPKTTAEIAENKHSLLDLFIRVNTQNDVLVYLGSKTIYVDRKEFASIMEKLNSSEYKNNLYDKTNYFKEFTKFANKVYGKDKCEKIVQLKDYLLIPYGYPEEIKLKDHTSVMQSRMYVYKNDI